MTHVNFLHLASKQSKLLLRKKWNYSDQLTKPDDNLISKKSRILVMWDFFYGLKNLMGYDNRIRTKYTAKWGVQIAGMIFQTRSKVTGGCYLE